jgi:hypothetical protein
MRVLTLVVLASVSVCLLGPLASASLSYPGPCSQSPDGVGITHDNSAGFSGDKYVYVCQGGQTVVRETLPFGGHPCDTDPHCNIPEFFVPLP